MFGDLWQYYRDEPPLNDPNVIIDFPGNSASFQFKQRITGERENKVTKNAEITVPLKYLSKFWRTLEMLLINCWISHILNWSANCVTSSGTVANQATLFAITDTKCYVPVVTLSTQDNAKLLQNY